MTRKIRAVLVALCVVLTLFLLAETFSVLSYMGKVSYGNTHTITVQGDGEATLPPDIARISFSVTNTEQEVADAQEATTQQVDKVLTAIEDLDVDENDIKTLLYNISPQYSYPNPCTYGSVCPDYTRTPKITGYRVSQTVQVTVRDLGEVGELLAVLGSAGVQNVSGPAFALDEEDAGYDAARADAIEKAKEQAKLLAKQLGVGLGDVVSFSEGYGGYPRPRMAYDGLGGDTAISERAIAPMLPTGENTYTASVSITYEIR